MIVVKIEYEIIEQRDKKWVATILAQDTDEAIKFTQKVVNNPININSVETLCKLNAISDSIIHKVLDVYGVHQFEQKTETAIAGATNESPINLDSLAKERKKKERAPLSILKKV